MNYFLDNEDRNFDKENYTAENNLQRTENEVTKEADNNACYPINKQTIDEELIRAVQKCPPLYDYRMPLKERSRQKVDLWKKVSTDLNGKSFHSYINI